MHDITITKIVRVTGDQIADQIVTAVEGGCNYWLASFKLVTPRLSLTAGREGLWYAKSAIWEDGPFLIRAVGLENDDGDEEWLLTPENLKRGLKVMATSHPKHFDDAFVSEGCDAETADVFLQCCLFEEIVYG
jgi:hypothetical protein